MVGPCGFSHFEVSCCDLWKVFEGSTPSWVVTCRTSESAAVCQHPVCQPGLLCVQPRPTAE